MNNTKESLEFKYYVTKCCIILGFNFILGTILIFIIGGKPITPMICIFLYLALIVCLGRYQDKLKQDLFLEKL